MPPAVPLLTGTEQSDVAVGAAACIGLTLMIAAYGLGLVGLLVVWATTRKYPYFQRGLLFGCVLWVVLLLGALAVCFFQLSRPGTR